MKYITQIVSDTTNTAFAPRRKRRSVLNWLSPVLRPFFPAIMSFLHLFVQSGKATFNLNGSLLVRETRGFRSA